LHRGRERNKSINAIAEKRNPETEISNGQIRKKDENTWECITCGHTEETKNLRSLIGHLGKHNKNTQIEKKQEQRKRKNAKAQVLKKEKNQRGKDRITGENKTENNTQIPEIIRTLRFFGHIKEKQGEQNIEWACTKCEKSWPTVIGTKNHVTRTCWKFKPPGKMICPFCNIEYKERKTLTGHLIKDGCEKLQKEYSHLTGEQIWEQIVGKNTR